MDLFFAFSFFCWCSSMDSVHAIGVHVVRKASGTSDTRDEDGVLSINIKLGHKHAHCGENGVIAASWAPTDLLVRRPVCWFCAW